MSIIIGFLAIIGIIFIMHKISKVISRWGSALTEFGVALQDYASTSLQNSVDHKKQIERDNKSSAEKILNIKGEESDVIYQDRVRQEIDELLKEPVPPAAK